MGGMISGYNMCHCKCLPGWTGPNCEMKEACLMHSNGMPCFNGEAVGGLGNCSCNCTYGFSGPNCNISAPCSNMTNTDRLQCLNGGNLTGYAGFCHC